jgi:hypothetical protein
MNGRAAPSYHILHRQPGGLIETPWRACLADADFPTHYTAPEYFSEPGFRNKGAFAVLSLSGEEVTAVLTGTNEGGYVQSGLSVRPQIVFSRRADRVRALANMVDGLLVEAGSAKLVDLFVWSDVATLVDPRFRKKQYEGVAMLDLSRGPDALFRKFSENKRRNIKRAIKYGVSVEPANDPGKVADYYSICVEWSRRKGLSIPGEEEFHQTIALRNNRLLLLARHEGKIVAGVVIRFSPHGVMEYAANSSLQDALHLRPNDLLHWRAIEWGCRKGMTHYSLGGAHLFLRKFGGEIVPTTRHRLDLSTFRRFAVGDWIAERAEQARPLIPGRLTNAARSLRGWLEKPRNPRAKTGRDRPPIAAGRISTGKSP